MKLSWFVCLAMVACDRKTSPAASTPPATTPPAVSAAPVASVVPDAAPREHVITFDADSLDAPSPSFEPVIGDWYVAESGGQRGLRVDGTKWQQGTPSASLADQAKKLYGDKYAEFLDGVKAFAFFPLAVYNGDAPKGDLHISLRFYPEAGRIDQGAGIAFDIGPDGSYQAVRANALEDNVLYFKVVKGKRTIIENVRNTPTPTKTWHTLAVDIRGNHLVCELDGTKRLERNLDAAPSGRVGLWSKADSRVLFDDVRIE